MNDLQATPHPVKNTDGQGSSRGVYDPVQKSATKPGFGPPHDTWATLLATLGLASIFFFSGRVQLVGDWVGWSGMIVSVVVGFALVIYFYRAYGFSWWNSHPNWAGLMAIFGATLVLNTVTSALHEKYAGEDMLGLVMSCLGMAMVIMGALRVGMGSARPAAQ